MKSAICVHVCYSGLKVLMNPFPFVFAEGIDLAAVSQAMLQSGLLNNLGNLDAQTLTALVAGAFQHLHCCLVPKD